jgi:AraC-like DNA-binding protein
MMHLTQSIFRDVDFDRHRFFATDDLDEVRYRCAQVFNPHRLALQGPHQKVRSRMDLLSFGRMALSRLTWGASVQVDPGSLKDFYLLVLPVRGRAVFHFDGAQIDVSSRAAAVVSPGRRFHFTASDDYEQIVLKLSQDAVAAAWSSLTVGEPAPSICFDVALPLHGQGWSALQPALQWLSRCTRLGLAATARAALLERTEELLATTFLLHHKHSHASRFWPGEERAQPLHMRRAQDYMQQHLGEALSAPVVAAHCGLSVRRLQALFQVECGMGPLQWLRQQRLHAVRESLLATTLARPSVSATALQFGFSHLGDFAKVYREAFDEAPRETLRRRNL